MPHEAFVDALRELYRKAGRPSYREISLNIRNDPKKRVTVSHTTIGALLAGKTLSRWRTVESVIRQLASDVVDEDVEVEAEVRRFFRLWNDATDSR